MKLFLFSPVTLAFMAGSSVTPSHAVETSQKVRRQESTENSVQRALGKKNVYDAGDCLEAREGVPGCSNKDCEELVCKILDVFYDERCCTESWNSKCAAFAQTSCGYDYGTCLDLSDGPGCSVRECEALVCKQGPSCCREGEEWDDFCVTSAFFYCGNGEYQGCGNCSEERKGKAGCSNRRCETIVCGADSSCCEDEWTATCAARAANACQSCRVYCDEFEVDGMITLCHNGSTIKVPAESVRAHAGKSHSDQCGPCEE